MESITLNQTLIELEENLRKLESARTQVDNVSLKSEMMIKSFNNIVVQLEKLNHELDEDEKGLLGSISGQVHKFNKSLIVQSDLASKQIKSLSTKLESDIDKAISELNKLQDEIIKKSDSVRSINYDEGINLISQQITNISKNIADLINHYNKTVRDIIQIISNLSELQIDSKLQINQGFDSIEKNMVSMINQINYLKQDTNKISEKLIKLEEKNDKNLKIISLYISIGLIVIIGFEFVLKYGILNTLFRFK